VNASTVALTRCCSYDRRALSHALATQFDLLGGAGQFVRPGDRVLLKPNFIAPRPSLAAVQTDPAIIVEVARLLKEARARPFVGDSPAWGSVFSCARALGLDEDLRRLDVPILPLDHGRRCRLADGRTTVSISSVALDADRIVNLPKFKAHQQLVFTFAVKNLFGCVPGKRKPYWHFRRGHSPDQFCRFLIEIYRLVSPVITIVDGIVAMEGQGPISGRPRPLGWLVGGADAIACERACAQLVNVAPDRVPLIRTAQRMGFGCPSAAALTLVGDDPSAGLCLDFKMAEQVPLRFSLGRVVKSIARGVVVSLRVSRSQKSGDQR
jgi:uncharacterized protein (DUF362 family)